MVLPQHLIPCTPHPIASRLLSHGSIDLIGIVGLHLVAKAHLNRNPCSAIEWVQLSEDFLECPRGRHILVVGTLLLTVNVNGPTRNLGIRKIEFSGGRFLDFKMP